ncbi:MAG: hypothetical protein SGBAC_003146 [Bacillariaceae sp.]
MEDDEPFQSEPNITTTFPQNVSDLINASSPSPALPLLTDAEGMAKFTNSTFNSSDPFNSMNNSTANETNSSVFDPLWGLLQNNWNHSAFGNRGGAFPAGGELANNSTDPTDITPTTLESGPITTLEGYILGIFCLGTVMLFIFAPAWYLDQRRHLAFVGRERRDARSRRGRRRRRQRRRLQRLLAQEGPPINDPPPTLLTKDYILSMLLTRTIEASDLLMEEDEKELPETPMVVNVLSDNTEDTAATNSYFTDNKDRQDIKDDDDDESYSDDLIAEEEEEDTSISIDDDDNENADCCAICLQGYKLGEEICYQTTEQSPCPHRFHRDCLVPWLLKHNVCPCCRVQYLPLPEPPEPTKEIDSEESEHIEAMSTTDSSASMEIQPSSIPHCGGDDDIRRRSTAPVIQDEEVGWNEKESLEGESSSSKQPTGVDPSMLLDDDDSLPCSTRIESDTEQVIPSEEVPILPEERTNSNESGHQKEPPIVLDMSAAPSCPPVEALLDPASLECDDSYNNHKIMAANEEYNDSEREADIMDLEAQMQLTTAIFDQRRGCFGLGKDFDADDNADTGDKDTEWDNASLHDDVHFSVPTPERRLSA